VIRLPFNLTLRFKSMLQSGIDMANLDVSYVSSISWYFLALFGLKGFISYFGGDEAASAVTAASVSSSPLAATGGMPLGTPGQHITQTFAHEAESLSVMKHQWRLESIEEKLIRRLSGLPVVGEKEDKRKNIPSSSTTKSKKKHN
jgi:hypothetical protein